MKKTHYFYLAGFAVQARSRSKAVHKFMSYGFARFVAVETVPIRNGVPRPTFGLLP